MLKKHVAAVHTSGVLSLVERKVANILLLNAYNDLVPEDGREVRHRIPVGCLGSMVGWDDSNNISSLKAALVSLQKTTVEFNLMKDGKETWESMSMLSYASVRNGVCTYGYVSELARKLSDPDVFATIALKFFETLPDDKQLKAGRFDHRSGKFASVTINAEFKPWLNKAVAPEFNLEAFEAYVREQGHDPVELGAYY